MVWQRNINAFLESSPKCIVDSPWEIGGGQHYDNLGRVIFLPVRFLTETTADTIDLNQQLRFYPSRGFVLR